MTDELRARGPLTIGEAILGPRTEEAARTQAAYARAAEARAMAWQGLGVVALVVALGVIVVVPAVVLWLYGALL